MLQIISFALGAGYTGYSWYKSATKEEEEKTFIDELMPTLNLISLLVAAVLLINLIKNKKS
jgi:hypothetical protein